VKAYALGRENRPSYKRRKRGPKDARKKGIGERRSVQLTVKNGSFGRGEGGEKKLISRGGGQREERGIQTKAKGQCFNGKRVFFPPTSGEKKNNNGG